MLDLRLLLASWCLLMAHSNAMGIRVRNARGEWVRPTWEKRHEPGEVLRLPLTNNGDKSYSLFVLTFCFAVDTSQIGNARAGGTNVRFHEHKSYCCRHQQRNYQSSTSQTYNEGSQVVTIRTAGGGCVQGHFSQDHVDLAHFQYSGTIAVTDPSVTGILYPDSVHGILGYGVNPGDDAPVNSTLLGVYTPRGLRNTDAEMGFELNHQESGVPGGQVTMGGTDSTAFAGNFTSMTVPPSDSLGGVPSWTVPIDEISATIGNSKTGASHKAGVLQSSFASIDPYYPFISVPSWAAESFYSQVPGAQKDTTLAPPVGGLTTGNVRYTVPCDSNINLSITFGGQPFVMAPRDAVSKEGGVCYGTVEVNDEGFTRVGSPFMRNVYTRFGAHYDENGAAKFSVGFATKTPRTSINSSSGTETGTVTLTDSTASSTGTALNANSSGNAALKNGPTSLTALVSMALLSLLV
ncbi:acid protease [Serendipita vermifera]|nr:acid protease [Serendipita vermifera]